MKDSLSAERGTVKNELKVFLKNAGAFDVGISSPYNPGYQNAEAGYKPLEVWPDCKSIVVFAVAMSPESNNTYTGPLSPHENDVPLGPVPRQLQSQKYAMNRMIRQIAAPIALAALQFFEHYNIKTSLKPVQCKVSGSLAGIGVYGKSGLLINPVLGNRMTLGLVMIDSELEPDPPLENFYPCENCNLCIELCPAEAYDQEKVYPDSWSRKACMQKRREIAETGSYCHNCFAVCPAGTIPDNELMITRKMIPITPDGIV